MRPICATAALLLPSIGYRLLPSIGYRLLPSILPSSFTTMVIKSCIMFKNDLFTITNSSVISRLYN